MSLLQVFHISSELWSERVCSVRKRAELSPVARLLSVLSGKLERSYLFTQIFTAAPRKKKSGASLQSSTSRNVSKVKKKCGAPSDASRRCGLSPATVQPPGERDGGGWWGGGGFPVLMRSIPLRGRLRRRQQVASRICVSGTVCMAQHWWATPSTHTPLLTRMHMHMHTRIYCGTRCPLQVQACFHVIQWAFFFLHSAPLPSHYRSQRFPHRLLTF